MNKFKTNHDYFNEINAENAYIIGYLLADGNIGINDCGNYYFQMNLHEKDIEILQMILDKIRPGDFPTHYKLKQVSGHVSNLTRIKVTSNQLCYRLIQLGIVPRKTGKEYLPKIPKKFLPDLIRGIFDGDGCICKKKRGEYVFSINSGNKKLVDDLYDYFGFGRVEKGHGKCWVYATHVREEIVEIMNILYYSDNILYLARKKDIYNNMPKNVKSKYTAFGETKTLKEWSIDNRCSTSYAGLIYRVNNTNLTFEECLITKSRDSTGDMFKRNKYKKRKHIKYSEVLE